MNSLWTLKHRSRLITTTFIVLVATLASLLLTTVLPARKAHADLEAARSAASFVDTIGVNIHLTYTNTVYGNYDNLIKPKLQELGIHHVRDGFPAGNGDATYENKLKDLASNGIYANLIADPRGLTTAQVSAALQRLGGAVTSVEGPNEYDNSGDANWVSTVTAYQQQLYQAVKGVNGNLPVYGPSFTSEAAYKAVGDLSNSVDASVMHNYYAGRNPETGGWGDNGYGSLTWNMNVAHDYAPNKPVISTETGYINSGSSTAIPEINSGRYVPRLYLEHFNAGVPRTFIYEFINEGTDSTNPEQNYGLLRNDGSEKPAFVALKNLIGLLQDSGTSFSPGNLDYTLSGSTANVQHTLLEKSDGTFYLALWIGAASYDVNNQQSITVPGQNVTVTLNQAASSATVYSLDDNGNMSSADAGLSNGQFNLGLTDRVTVVKLSGVSSGGGASSFSSGFESGDPQPTWTNTVDAGGYPAGNSANVGGICCGLSGPEAGTRNETTHSGATALMYSGYDNDATTSYAYMKVFDLSNLGLQIGPNTTLSYWIYPQSQSSSGNHASGTNSTCAAIDLIFSDGSNLRDSGAVDQNGNRLHPGSQCNHLNLDSWNQVTSKIGASSVNGKTVVRIDVGYDQGPNTGGYRGYIDDIKIG